MSSRIEKLDFASVAAITGISADEVRKIVSSFFDDIAQQVDKLPYDDVRRIYSKEVFNCHTCYFNIPSIGRIGTSYSRYLQWRANEAKSIEQVHRSHYQSRLTQNDIEHMAEEILSGKTPSPVYKKKGNELYNRVWLVKPEGKKLARQVIPKESKDV